MAKHTLKDILQIFATHAGHTHEAAVQATYDAGHAAGVAEVKEKILAGDKGLHAELDARQDAIDFDKAAKRAEIEANDKKIAEQAAAEKAKAKAGAKAKPQTEGDASDQKETETAETDEDRKAKQDAAGP